MRRPIIMAITNHKGGVGKTTLAVNLPAYLINYFNKILIIDFDPQAHSSWWLCQYTENIQIKLQDLLKFIIENNLDNQSTKEKLSLLVKEATYDTFVNKKQLSLITSSLKLAKTKSQLSAEESTASFKIVELIKYISKDYDLVIIDTPPSLEILTFSSVASSDYIILPVQLDSLSISGALDIINDILPAVRKYYNPHTKIIGVAINLYSNTKVAKVTKRKIKEVFGEYVFKTTISRSVRMQELNVLRNTLNKVSPKSKSSLELTALAEEIYYKLSEKV